MAQATHDSVCLDVLLLESTAAQIAEQKAFMLKRFTAERLQELGGDRPTPQQESEKKIRGRLKRRGIAFDADRVDILRRFKDELIDEVCKGKESKYYSHSDGVYADMKDFDAERMKADLAKRHPDVSAADIAAAVPYAIFVWWVK